MTRNLNRFVFSIVLLLLSGLAVQQTWGQRADCAGGVCYPDSGWGPTSGTRYVIPDDPTVPSSLGHSAHCRIFVADGSTGSGTLIARNDATGLVLTCAHLFDAATSNIIVAFPDGARYGGRLIDRDRANDLAAVLIGHPDVGPVSVDDDWRIELSAASMLTAGGYGGDGRFRPVRGPVSGTVQAVGATDPSVKITGTVRPGDSGGGVLDADGRLIGVV